MRAGLGILLAALLAFALWMVWSDGEGPATPDPAAAAASGKPAATAPNPAAGTVPAAPTSEALARSPVAAGDAAFATIPHAGVITGLVLDPAGHPVEDAAVAFFRREQSAAFSFGVETQASLDRLLRTDREGRYRAHDLPAGGSWNLLAWHEEFSFVHGPAVTGSSGAPQELPPIRLDDGFVLAGVVVDFADRPVVGALLEFALDGVDEPTDPLGRRFVQTSAADGTFTCSGLGGGVWSLRARHPGLAEGWMHPLVLLPGQAIPALQVRLGAEYPLAGRVISSAGGPVADAEVLLAADATDRGRRIITRAAADGSFELHGAGEGRWTLTAQRPGFLPSRPLTLESESRADLTLELQPIGGALLRVLGPGGAIPAEARAELWRPMRGQPPFQPTGEPAAKADAEGFVRMQVREPGTYVLLIRALDCAPAWSELFHVSQQQINLGEYPLQPAGSVSGRLVRQQNGSPIAGASVALRSLQWTPAQNEGPFAALLADATDIPPAAALTGTDGSFRLESLAILPALIVIEHPDFARVRVPVQPAPGREIALGEVRADAAATLRVHGLDPGGQPLAGGSLLLQREEQGLSQSTHLLDAAGRVTLTGLESGDWWVSVIEGGGIFGRMSPRQRVWLPAGGEEEVELRVVAP
jgi:hypothetical protein